MLGDANSLDIRRWLWLLFIVFLLLPLEEVVELTCLDNNSVTGRIDNDAPLGKLGIDGISKESTILLFEETAGTTS